MRIRPVKKYGNTFVITLTKYDMDDFQLEEGDEVDIEEVVKFVGRKKK